jgi:signal transduction histidine kinase
MQRSAAVRTLAGVHVLDRFARLGRPTWIAALGLVLAAALASDVRRVFEDGGWPLTLAIGVVASVAALARSRGLVRAAAAAIAAGGVGIVVSAAVPISAGDPAAVTIALLVLGVAASRALPGRHAAGIAVAGSAVVVASPLVEQQGSPASGAAIFGLLAWGVALGVGLWLRWRDDRRRAGLDAARADERLGLARELHDQVAHHIAGIAVQAQAARLVADRQPQVVSPALGHIEAAAGQAMTAMRRLIGVLRDPDDSAPTRATSEDLRILVDRFRRSSGDGPAVDLDLAENLPEPAWPPEVTATIYRVVQEALINVARHASGAQQVRVHVGAADDAVTVEVSDDAPSGGVNGHGIGSGYGLVGMRERVEALGGQLSAGRNGRPGWQVSATLPVHTRRAP